MWRQSLGLSFLTALLLLVVVMVTAVPRTAAEKAASTPTGLLTSNGLWLEAGLPIPVFQFAAPQITGDDTASLGGLFSAIGQETPSAETYLGRNRFTIFNEASNSILEQYGATGGLYAYNPTEAFGETARGPLDPVQAQRSACQFLLYNELFPDNDMVGTPDVSFCDYDFNQNPYPVSLIYAATADSNRVQIAEEVIGAVVQVPMYLRTGIFSQLPSVPLGGPGGHVSLLFRTTNPNDTGFTLDDDIVGLGAVAMPFHGRFPDFVANFPTRDPIEVEAEVRAMVEESYPTATITMTAPALLYMVSDAAQPQRALEPMLEFEGIEVEVDGEIIIFRSLVVPALEGGASGFGPDVAITGPADHSLFTPGTAVPLTGTIGAGTAPYTYTWTVDGAVVLTGTVGTAGEVFATAADLPAISHGGSPAGVVVVLEVEDDLGAVRQAAITLNPAVAPNAYLPAVLNAVTGDAPAELAQETAVPRTIMATYRFGVHAGSDYPPYGPGGPDLGGVIPDANGFRSSMSGYGWTSTYNWWNSAAWEKDWRDCSLGGGDCTYGVDRVDFAYYAGHSGPGGLSMPSNNKDRSWFAGTDARFQTVRWAGFASCQALRAQWTPASQAPIRDWFGAFQGAHMLLGFNSNMADVAFGPRLVDNMRIPTIVGIPIPFAQRTIAEAWVQTAFQMNAGKPAYLYAVGTNGVNPIHNKLPKSGDPAMPRPYPVASYHWVWWNE